MQGTPPFDDVQHTAWLVIVWENSRNKNVLCPLPALKQAWKGFIISPSDVDHKTFIPEPRGKEYPYLGSHRDAKNLNHQPLNGFLPVCFASPEPSVFQSCFSRIVYSSSTQLDSHAFTCFFGSLCLLIYHSSVLKWHDCVPVSGELQKTVHFYGDEEKTRGIETWKLIQPADHEPAKVVGYLKGFLMH